MPHIFEPASSGRAKCRGCGLGLQKGEIRFGERLPNPFAEGEVTHWFHPACAAYKRPQAVIETIEGGTQEIADRANLERLAREAFVHHRLPRIDGAERSPSGQAKCRHCKEPIEKGAWRIRLVLQEEGNFSPGGFVHLACHRGYFEAGDITAQVLHFSPALDEAEREALRSALAESVRPPSP